MRTTKAERKRAKRDSIRWRALHRRSQRSGGDLVLLDPPPRAGVAAWARLNRAEPVPLRVQLPATVTIRTEQKEGADTSCQ